MTDPAVAPSPADAVRSVLDQSPYARFLGATCSTLGDEVTVSVRYREEILGNPATPAWHGGVIAAAMEMAAVAQLAAMAGEAGFAKPISVSIDYLRIGKPGDIYARASITRQGSRIANVRALAWQSRPQDPIATLHGHFLAPRAE